MRANGKRSGWAPPPGTSRPAGGPPRRRESPVMASTSPPDDPALHALADRLSRRWFQAPFDGRVLWAARLRYRAGEFRPADGAARISRPYHDKYGPQVTEGIGLHELGHWWLHRSG